MGGHYWFVIGTADLEIALINLHRGHIMGMVRSSLPSMDMVVAIIEFTEEWEEEDMELHFPDSTYVMVDCRCKAEAAWIIVGSLEGIRREGSDLDCMREHWFFGECPTVI